MNLKKSGIDRLGARGPYVDGRGRKTRAWGASLWLWGNFGIPKQDNNIFSQNAKNEERKVGTIIGRLSTSLRVSLGKATKDLDVQADLWLGARSNVGWSIIAKLQHQCISGPVVQPDPEWGLQFLDLDPLRTSARDKPPKGHVTVALKDPKQQTRNENRK